MDQPQRREERKGNTWLSQREAARRLPISATTLREFARHDVFYGPDVDGLAGVPAGARFGRSVMKYRVEHVGLIEAVLEGVTPIETARIQWELMKRGEDFTTTTRRTRRMARRAG